MDSLPIVWDDKEPVACNWSTFARVFQGTPYQETGTRSRAYVLERGNGQTWLRGHRDQQMTPIMSGLLRSTTNTRIAKNSPLKADRKTTLEQ